MEHHQRIFLLHGLLGSIVSVRVEGAERIPAQGGVLLICNHSDLIDPLLQGLYSGRDLSYLAKAELIDGNPLRRFRRFVERAQKSGVPALVVGILTEVLELFTQMLRDAKILPIIRAYRSGRAASSMEYYNEVIANVVLLLNEVDAVAMYPEGGRSFDGKLKPFRGLAARIAIQAQVPVVPCALVGAHGFSDLNRWVSGRRTSQRSILYKIGEPIQPDSIVDSDSREQKEQIKSLTQQLHGAVNELLDQRPARPTRAERRPRATKSKSKSQSKSKSKPKSKPVSNSKSEPESNAKPATTRRRKRKSAK